MEVKVEEIFHEVQEKMENRQKKIKGQFRRSTSK